MSGFLPAPQDKCSAGLWTVETDGLVATDTAFECLDQPAAEHLVAVR